MILIGFKLDKKKVILSVSILICYLISLASTSEMNPPTGCDCNSPNVRTVLFKSSDIERQCWNQEEIALLYARRLVQEILPRKVPNNMNYLMEYIKMCLKTLQEEVSSKSAHNIILLAMTDAWGGYLQAFGFPIAKAKYYEGTVSYCITKQMNELFDTTKQVLGTDGGSWTRPIYVKKSVTISPFVVPNPSTDNACSCLITSYDMSSCPTEQNSKPSLSIPLPFLDSATHPCAVALPFRNRSLYSLMTKDSSDILLRYYTAAAHCLYKPAEDSPGMGACSSTPQNNPAMQQFNVDFHNWLVRVVLPHLHDEKWYPGFGSVWRLIETMTRKGIKTVAECPDTCFSITVSEKDECKQTSVWFYIVSVLIFLLLFWLCVCCICACARLCRKRSTTTLCSTTSSSSGHVVNALLTLYEGSQKKKQPTGYKSMGNTLMRQKSFASQDSDRYHRSKYGRYKR